MFYLKITYFAAGLALSVLAAIVSPHMRDRPAIPLILLGLIVLNAVAPWNHAYLADIFEAVDSGAVRSKFTFHINNYLTNVEGNAAYLTAIAFAGWLWWRGLASVHERGRNGGEDPREENRTSAGFHRVLSL